MHEDMFSESQVLMNFIKPHFKAVYGLVLK